MTIDRVVGYQDGEVAAPNLVCETPLPNTHSSPTLGPGSFLLGTQDRRSSPFENVVLLGPRSKKIEVHLDRFPVSPLNTPYFSLPVRPYLESLESKYSILKKS